MSPGPAIPLKHRIQVKRAAHSFANGGKKPRLRRGRLPRQASPDAQRLAYFQKLRGLTNRMRELTRERVLPLLKELLPAGEKDSLTHTHIDADKEHDAARVRAAINGVAKQITSELSPSRISKLAEEAARATSSKHKAELQKQIRSAVGVEVELAEPWLTPMIQRFTADNVALVKDVPVTFFAQTEALAVQAVREGTRWETIAEQIEERGDVSESRAKLIARDQVGKLFGALNETRQTELGITNYIWRTSNDNRVRDTHDKREGETYSWDDPPGDLSDPADGGHPGFPINCRCYPDPDLSELIDEL